MPQKFIAAASPQTASLLDRVVAACNRLAPRGWAAAFKAHGLDIEASDLRRELQRPLAGIDRSISGFQDFAAEGVRGIEPGQPAKSLLFHGFASPEVSLSADISDGDGLNYPTLAEIEAVENLVYGFEPPTIEDLRARSDRSSLAVVVFASEYRPAVDTVHRRHADMCYSRTGISRIGVRAPKYDAPTRGFSQRIADDDFAVSVLPCRYSAYIAALQPGQKGKHGPANFVEPQPSLLAGGNRRSGRAGLIPPPAALDLSSPGDNDRMFWIPVHKLFDGTECISGFDIAVRLAAQHLNEKIRRAHLLFGAAGHNGGWSEPDISRHPFVITQGIAEFSSQPDDGSWLLVPVARPTLIEPAEYLGKPLTYSVPRTTNEKTWRPYESSLNLRPAADGARKAPEYLHARHKLEGGIRTNLNSEADVKRAVRTGEYSALHYVDYTGDGWVDVECPALVLEVPRRLPAYSVVACPDFFPHVRQSELVAWTDQSVPPQLLDTIWPVVPGRPDPLCAQRVAANIELKGAGFDPLDDTVTAIVGCLKSGDGVQLPLATATRPRISMLPDSASGVFSPGWDVSYDSTDTVPGIDRRITFLTNYGLGSPFPEDSMLCAALSSFWPAAAPDITRTFAPNVRYATATPLTDDVIGIDGGMPWDGVFGPVEGPEPNSLTYKALAYGDYVEATIAGHLNFAAFHGLSTSEYVARTVTMAMVYEALGATTTPEKAKWSVLSFRKAQAGDPDLDKAEKEHGRRLDLNHTYRFVMVRHGGIHRKHPDPAQFDKVVIDVQERVLMFADPTIVMRRVAEKWVTPYERSR